jgi:hypothetical protein
MTPEAPLETLHDTHVHVAGLGGRGAIELAPLLIPGIVSAGTSTLEFSRWAA